MLPHPGTDHASGAADPFGTPASMRTRRGTPLAELGSLVAGFGVRPERLAELAGLGPEQLLFGDATLPLAGMARLLSAATALTGRDDIGLLLGRRIDALAGLGLVGQAMRHAPDLRTALDDLLTHQRRSADAPILYLLRANEEVFLGCALPGPAGESTSELLDAVIAAGVGLIRSLVGVVASEILLARRQPAAPDAYRAVLGAPVRFDAPMTALVLDARALARSIPDADPCRRARLLADVAASRTPHPPDIAADVVRALLPHIVFGAATLDAIAASLGIHPRTLERRLREEGLSFRSLQSRLQLDVACRLLRDTRMSVAAISEALGYCDPSAFGKWFRRAAGATPAHWRERSGCIGQPDGDATQRSCLSGNHNRELLGSF
ncbi:AraC family transcriptional regulator [Falsiroseomonas oryziterrae]|uniref:AraC family transcriptional regulator n=1 Tax=Falsiroseomonas oryziterrae TaxID=2911368 RepID=UPI001F1820EE|nr:AraC family transcriptional regulator [Roseomonas sp. NPKOSM-4]